MFFTYLRKKFLVFANIFFPFWAVFSFFVVSFEAQKILDEANVFAIVRAFWYHTEQLSNSKS